MANIFVQIVIAKPSNGNGRMLYICRNLHMIYWNTNDIESDIVQKLLGILATDPLALQGRVDML
jgi:hypothetical protein